MNIKEIYEKFDAIGSLTFATTNEGYPETRIAHFFAYDEAGLYFRTMFPKPFYKQLKKDKKMSVCGLYGATEVTHGEDGMPEFQPGYSMRVTGDIKEIPLEEIQNKNKNKELFDVGIKDVEKYPAMRIFVLYRGKGEIFDFDFETKFRDHKLLRTNFSFNGFNDKVFGLEIKDNCIRCGKCFRKCSFKAIDKIDKDYIINNKKCDVCGDCTVVCPVNAIGEK